MELLYVIYTHNRSAVLQECWRTLFGNNDLRPQRVVMIDDGSERPLKESLSREALNTNLLVDFFSFKENVGYARAAEIGFAAADMFNPHYCFFIESDYIFRKHGLDEVMDVLTSDAGGLAAGVAGYSHPDFFKPGETMSRYHHEMVMLHGRDNLNRDVLYKPFPFKSRYGDIQLQFVSNSCGTMYLNWTLISKIRKAFYPRMETEWIERACRKGQSNTVLDDGAMSQTLSYYWTEYAQSQGWDTSRYAALVDIIPSVANHLCGSGISARGTEEGQTSVGSPSFPTNYDEYRQSTRIQSTSG